MFEFHVQVELNPYFEQFKCCEDVLRSSCYITKHAPFLRLNDLLSLEKIFKKIEVILRYPHLLLVHHDGDALPLVMCWHKDNQHLQHTVQDNLLDNGL